MTTHSGDRPARIPPVAATPGAQAVRDDGAGYAALERAPREVLDFWFGEPGSTRFGGAWKNWFSARRHAVIIERFGRYPHRNAVLGRVSTDEERAFLLEPGSSF